MGNFSLVEFLQQRTKCQEQYPCSELNIKEEAIFRSFTQKAQTFSSTVVHQWADCVLWKALLVVSADKRVLAEPLCSAKASAGAGARQQWAAPFCLQAVHGAKETVDFLKKTHGDVLLSGDHANFSNYVVFWLSACQHSPSSGARHWHEAAPGAVTQRVTRCFSQHSSGGATWVFPSKPQQQCREIPPPCVLGSGCIQKSRHERYKPPFGVVQLGLQTGQASWDFGESNGKEEAAKPGVWFLQCPTANWWKLEKTGEKLETSRGVCDHTGSASPHLGIWSSGSQSLCSSGGNQPGI